MSEYTTEDFAAARFAEHPHGTTGHARDLHTRGVRVTGGDES